MKVRLINNKEITGTSNKFNTTNNSEVLMYFDKEGGASSEFISDLEVKIKDKWLPLLEAFKQKILIVDNYNTELFEPKTNEEKERGYRL